MLFLIADYLPCIFLLSLNCQWCDFHKFQCQILSKQSNSLLRVFETLKLKWFYDLLETEGIWFNEICAIIYQNLLTYELISVLCSQSKWRCLLVRLCATAARRQIPVQRWRSWWAQWERGSSARRRSSSCCVQFSRKLQPPSPRCCLVC